MGTQDNTAFGKTSILGAVRDYLQSTNSKDVGAEDRSVWLKENMPGGVKSPGVGAAPAAPAAAPVPPAPAAPAVATTDTTLPPAAGAGKAAPPMVQAPDREGKQYWGDGGVYNTGGVEPAKVNPYDDQLKGMMTDIQALQAQAPAHIDSSNFGAAFANAAKINQLIKLAGGVVAPASSHGHFGIAENQAASMERMSQEKLAAEESMAANKLRSEDPMWQAHSNYYNALAKAAGIKPEEALKLQQSKDYDALMKSDIVLADMQGTDAKDLPAKAKKWQDVWAMMHPDNAKGPAKPPITREQAIEALKLREAAKK